MLFPLRYAHAVRFSSKSGNADVSNQDEKSDIGVIIEQRVRSSARGLQDALREKIKRGAEMSLIVLYFDEAHELHGPPAENTRSRPDTRFDALCWVLDLLKYQDMFSIFLSTNSSLSSFAPTRREYPSDRFFNEAVHVTLQPPITELPFGNPNWKVTPSDYTVDDVKRPEFMAQLGRAL
jgi:hypothetical protein